MRLSSLLTSALLIGFAPAALAQLATYSEDFEALDSGDPGILGATGWVGFANVFDSSGNFLYNYGTFPAPNGTPGFSSVAGGAGGVDQGAQYINIYSDYNNTGAHGAGDVVEASVFRDMPIAAGDVGATWTLSFDYLQNPDNMNSGATTTAAFIKVLKSSDGSFATLFQNNFDSTAVSTSTWGSTSLDILIDPTFAGELLQIGFVSFATNFEDSGRFYDNILFDSAGSMGPALTPYAQDFEALDMADPAALAADNWKIFVNVFDSMFNYLGGYGVFDAPNGGPGFSAIGTGDGGPNQMTQYLNAYSDYGNGNDHSAGNILNTNLFQEQTAGASNVGETWRFGFDFRKNPFVGNGDGNSSTEAFIKVIKVSDGSFATLFQATFDSTGISDAAWGSTALDVLIDPSYVGEVVQFGYGSFATMFEDTGRYYDNITWGTVTNPGLGEVVCLGNPNSTTERGVLTVTGSDVLSDNNLTLSADNLPLNTMGYFLHSLDTVTVYNPAMSEGNLCIASLVIGRFAKNILDSGATGSVSLTIDLADLPGPVGPIVAVVGETRNFQYWHRDSNMGAMTSNFSSAVGVTFQ